MFKIEELVELFNKYEEEKEKIIRYLDAVARKLNHNCVSNINFIEDEVSITCEWYGAFQSHDTSIFTFPSNLLNEGTDKIAKYLSDKIEEENKIKQEEAAARAKEQRLKQYETLKKEFENA